MEQRRNSPQPIYGEEPVSDEDGDSPTGSITPQDRFSLYSCNTGRRYLTKTMCWLACWERRLISILKDEASTSDDEYQPRTNIRRNTIMEVDAEDDLVCYRLEGESSPSPETRSRQATKSKSPQDRCRRARTMGQGIGTNPQQHNRRCLATRILRLLERMPARPDEYKSTIAGAT